MILSAPDVDLLWSKGVAADCVGPFFYRRLPTEHLAGKWLFRLFYSGAAGLVWVRLGSRSGAGQTCDLDRFVEVALPRVKRRFVLLTTDGDAAVPSELPKATVQKLLDNPLLVAWRTQNYDGHPHPKLRAYPIGLDLHSGGFHARRRRLAALERVRDDRDPVEALPLRVFCDLNLNLNSVERGTAAATLQGCAHVDFARRRVSVEEIWRRYASYPFVLSARGNGLDCHRTWEVLYLGGIVITKASSLDPLYEGLPVVAVDDWAAVRDVGNLRRWRERCAPLTAKDYVWERLSSRRMLQAIRGAAGV
jgi:hypothetical protein